MTPLLATYRTQNFSNDATLLSKLFSIIWLLYRRDYKRAPLQFPGCTHCTMTISMCLYTLHDVKSPCSYIFARWQCSEFSPFWLWFNYVIFCDFSLRYVCRANRRMQHLSCGYIFPGPSVTTTSHLSLKLVFNSSWAEQPYVCCILTE